MLKRLIKDLVRSRRTGRRMRSESPLPAALQAQTVAALRTLALLPDSAREAELMGFKVAFQNPSVLRFLFREIFVESAYYFETRTTQPVVIDAGANIGMATLYFKKLYPDARVICFEPDPDNFPLLKRNLEGNGLAGVELHQVALSDSEEPLVFFRSPSGSTLRNSTIRERVDSPEEIRVPAVRLSGFIRSAVDLLKLDVEGGEGRVLADLIASGKLANVMRLHMEYHHHIDGERNDLSQTLALLEQAGFGYQVRADQRKWPVPRGFQDISIFAYRQAAIPTEA
jgi:FkbM family methyltransferase